MGESPRGIRIPLQSGDTTLVYLWWGTITLVASLGGAAMVAKMGGIGGMPWFHVFFFIVPLVFFGASVLLHVLALRARASDILLTAHELRVEGGRRTGLRFAMETIDPVRTRVVVDVSTSSSSSKGTTYAHHLLLGLRDGKEERIATSLDRAEEASFTAVVETLRALRGGAVEAPIDARYVVSCPACSAPAVPVDAPTIACTFCGAAVPMRDDVRARMRANAALMKARRHTAGVVERLLSQPTATRVNRWIALSLCAKYLVPVGFVLMPRLWIFSIAGAWALGHVIKAQLVDRRAFRALALDFGAALPRSGGGPRCRICGGPLPPAIGVLARCAYCGADNLLGVDIETRASAAGQHALDLDAVLRARRRERLRQQILVAIGVVLALGGLALAW